MIAQLRQGGGGANAAAPRLLRHLRLFATGFVLAVTWVGSKRLAALPDPIPSTAPPTQAEWEKAALAAPLRVSGERASACQLRKVGAWFNVKCPTLPTSAITQLAGDPQNVHLRLEPATEDGLPGASELTFLTAAEQRLVFSFWTVGEGYDGPLTVVAAVVVQVDVPRNGAPTLLLHDALNEPMRTAQSELRRQRAATVPHELSQPP